MPTRRLEEYLKPVRRKYQPSRVANPGAQIRRAESPVGGLRPRRAPRAKPGSRKRYF